MLVALFAAVGWTLAPQVGPRPEGLAESLYREVPDVFRLPEGRYRLLQEWEAEGPSFGHRIGRRVEDADAGGGAAWEAGAGRDAPHAHALFGPYADTPAGDYVAFFRIKLLDEPVRDFAAEVDACVEYGRRVLNSLEVADGDLVRDKYVQVPLAFRSPGGKLECRVLWRGNVSLRIDKVTLFRIEGAPIEHLIHRAPPPIPSGEPKELPYRAEPRPFPEIFPRSAPPSPTLLVADIRPLPADEQLALITLQGLVNRSQPQLYLLFNETDPFWLERLLRQGWVKATETVPEPHDLLRRFHQVVKGMVIYDPLLPATKNVATMLCSVEDAMAVSPRLARQLDLPIIADLRERWPTNAEAYEWAFHHLWTRLNHHVIACAYPDHIGMRDYFVQHRLFIFWISGPIDGARRGGDPTAEVRLMERLFAQMPANIPIMSYPWAGQDVGIGEGAGVTLFSEFGKYLVGSINCSNLSVHSGIPIPKVRQQEGPSVPPLSPSKVYYAIIISDGDNLPVLTVHNFPQLWRSPVRGKLPLGWTISPSALMLIPAIVDYYFATATPNDGFLGAVSGIGYCYPDHYGKRFSQPDRQRVFDEFLEQTATSMERMDLQGLWIMGATQPQLIRRYAEKIPNLRALFVDYGRRLNDPSAATYPTARHVAVFHAVTGWREEDSREERVRRMVDEIRAMTPPTRPAFLHVFVWNWGFDLEMLQEVAQRLGDEYVPVRPDHLEQLYRRWLTQQRWLVKAPTKVVGVEGVPIAFEVGVFNAIRERIALGVEVLEGLKAARRLPEQASLAPGEEVRFTIVGIPTGGPVRLRVGEGAAARQVPLALERLAQEELMEPLPKGVALRFVAEFEAEQLAHVSGEAEKEAAASGGVVWVARRGRAQPGHIVYGPYLPVGEGRYLALFRLKRLGEGEGILAVVDSCVGGGKPVTAERRVKASELPKGEFRLVPLPLTHPGGLIETRVFWAGQADLAVDRVVLWEALPQP